MFEKLLSLIERIAVALETLASAPVTGLAPAKPVEVVVRSADTAVQSNTTPPPTAPPAVATVQTTAAALDFTAPPPATPAPAAAGQPAQQITREIVGNALIALATDPLKGRDAAVSVLSQFGGAQKLDQVKEVDYAALYEAIKKAAA